MLNYATQHIYILDYIFNSINVFSKIWIKFGDILNHL